MGRIELQRSLEEKIGSRNVYFQPPESTKIKYPAFIYNLSNIRTNKADNIKYKLMNEYTGMYITDDPDDPVIQELLSLPYTSFDRSYISENLYHNVYSIFN